LFEYIGVKLQGVELKHFPRYFVAEPKLSLSLYFLKRLEDCIHKRKFYPFHKIAALQHWAMSKILHGN